ncbi:MAG: SpoIIE family protein phosphatase [SAR324 cluster bacterium]|nr:SpoIIE family protein phosphatase [SAR324 cluster bacterium]
MARILILDDDESVVTQTEQMIRSYGYIPLGITQSDRLMVMLKQNNVDLILLDVHMPEMSGIELLKQLKHSVSYRTIPVIMLTRDTREELLEECLNSGAADFINKPFSPIVLKARLQSALNTLSFVRSQQRLIEEQESITQKLHEELEMAGEMQSHLMRSDPLPPHYKSAMFFRPYSQVSGDFYNQQVTDGSLHIFLGDATGHGITAALLTMMLKAGLSSIPASTSPANVMWQLNHLLKKSIPGGMFVTGIYLKINADGSLVMCNAGHPPLLVFPENGNEPVILDDSGVALGIFKNEEIGMYEQVAYRLNPRDKVFIFTDGITEYQRQKKELGIQGVTDFLWNLRHLDISIMVNKLSGLLTPIRPQTVKDDMTFFAFEYLGA